MQTVIQKFLRETSGAALVEYAIALIVVTVVGGAGVIAIGFDTGAIVTTAGSEIEETKTLSGS